MPADGASLGRGGTGAGDERRSRALAGRSAGREDVPVLALTVPTMLTVVGLVFVRGSLLFLILVHGRSESRVPESRAPVSW